MSLSKKQLLTIKSEIIDSMQTNAGKTNTSRYFRMLEEGRVRARYVVQRIEYLIRMGHSNIKNINKLREMYDFKLYYEKNKDEMSDYYESENVNTNAG
tara:strand:+ start:304 stop:597 length:294 start_codon:yes stop_codon:yes gene_type:complete